MRGAIIGFGVGISVLCSCMPDLAANGAQRCTEQLECSPDAVCYRGFCLAAEDVADASVWEAGAPSGLAVGAERDAGSAAAPVDGAATGVSQRTPEAGAASGHNAPAADAAAESAAPASSADPRPAADPAPRTTPDAGPAGGMSPQPGATIADAGSASPAEAGPAQPKDAGHAGPGTAPSPADAATAPADAAVPPPTLRPGCTFADCCAEALRAAQDAREEGDDKKDDKGSKKCGCANPALLGTVFCSLLGPWGVLP